MPGAERTAGSGQRAVEGAPTPILAAPPPAARRPRSAFFLAALLLAACANEAPVHDQAMRDALGQLRQSIAKFQNDNGRFPHTLDELVPRYLTKIPADPVTGSATTWRLTMEETVRPSSDFSTAPAAPAPAQIIAVHSGAAGTDSTGKRWSDY